MRTKKTLLLLSLILASVTLLISLKYSRVPYFWIALSLVLVTFFCVMASKRSIVKALWFNMGVVLLTFGIFEFYLYQKDIQLHERLEGTIQGNFYQKDDILGYSPKKNSKVTAIKYYKNNLIYNVTYTTNSNGLRMTPAAGNITEGCILFFGGSFTFGEGLNDTETMPYIVGLKSFGKYSAHNFGFSGYGPHQMLAALENKLEDNVIRSMPKYAIIQTYPNAISRPAGHDSWDEHGPRYILGKNGDIIFSGHFDDYVVRKNKNNFQSRIVKQLEKSRILNNIYFKNKQWFEIDYEVVDYEIELYLDIMNKSRNIIEHRYPGSEFHVIYWDKFENRYPFNKNIAHIKWENYIENKLLEGFRTKNIRVHLVSKILPGYEQNALTYAISPYEGHPNYLANRLMADYLCRFILKI